MRLLSSPLASYLSTAALLTLFFSPTALADVEFTAPAAGAEIPAGPITITFAEGAGSPSISQLSTYTLSLIVGGNEDTNQIPLTTITSTGKFSTGYTVTGNIAAGLAASTPNGFFLKMQATAKSGGILTAYSDRFTITGMTGTTPAAEVAAVQALGGSTKGPQGVNGVSNSAGTTAAAAAPGETIVDGPAAAANEPYSMQTAGTVKYAPMQGIPPTKITKTNTAPLYPQSSVTIAKTFLPAAQFVSTVTPSQTFSVQSIQNTIAAQSQPTGDMEKFLARWKD